MECNVDQIKMGYLLPRNNQREGFTLTTQKVEGCYCQEEFIVEENTRHAFLSGLDLATRTHHPVKEKSDGKVIGFSFLHNLLSQENVNLDDIRRYMSNAKVDRFEKAKENKKDYVQYDTYVNIATNISYQNQAIKYDGHIELQAKRDYIERYFEMMVPTDKAALDWVLSYIKIPYIDIEEDRKDNLIDAAMETKAPVALQKKYRVRRAHMAS